MRRLAGSTMALAIYCGCLLAGIFAILCATGGK